MVFRYRALIEDPARSTGSAGSCGCRRACSPRCPAPRQPLTWDERQALIPRFEEDIRLLEHITGESFRDWLAPRGASAGPDPFDAGPPCVVGTFVLQPDAEDFPANVHFRETPAALPSHIVLHVRLLRRSTRAPPVFAAVLPVGVLAHRHGADRLVTAYAEPGHERNVISTQYEGDSADPTRQRSWSLATIQYTCLRPITSAKWPNTNAPRKAAASIVLLSRPSLPELRVQSLVISAEGDPDDEQVVGIGEEPIRTPHRPQVKSAQRGLIERSDQVPGPYLGHGIPPPLMLPHASRRAAFPSAAAERIRLGQRAADLEMNDK